MKKVTFILLLLVVSTIAIHSQSINLGDFPLGKWLDSNWDATWEFESDNIRILDSNGGVYYDFEGKTIEDFQLKPSAAGLVLSFSCKETGKKYQFTKPLTNLNLLMVIDTDTGNHYEVELPLKN